MTDTQSASNASGESVVFPKRDALLAAVKTKLSEFAGMTVTLRQLYYRLVAAGVIPNNFRAYKNLGAAVTAWRRSGEVPIEAFEDRTRHMGYNDIGNSVNNPDSWASSYLRYGVERAKEFTLKRWWRQPYQVIVAVEKQALEGPFAEVCEDLGVDLAVCRGYPSLSFLREIANDIGKDDARKTVVLYFGDLDPSGLDIPRAVENDLTGFFGKDIGFERPALTHEQVEQMNLIPAPVKMTDARAEGFIAEHGNQVYELDAIEPRTLQAIIRENVEKFWNDSIGVRREQAIAEGRARIEEIMDELDIDEFLARLDKSGDDE